MPQNYLFYIEANFICLFIIGIMLIHDYLNKSRQEKQIKFDHSLIAFMLYCVSDALWAMVVDNIIPQNDFTIALTNYLNFTILIAITYTWLNYVMAVEQVSYRKNLKIRLFILSPFVISVIVLISLYFINKSILIDNNNEPTLVYHMLMNFVTYIYITVVLVHTLRRAIKEKNRMEKRRQIELGFLPLAVVASGILQMLVAPNNPIFCFCCLAILLVYYIETMEDQISLDPLTKLNNRGQLLNYVSSENGGYKEGKRNYVIMMDINYFKEINDNYGHSEGDNALVLVANSIKTVLARNAAQSFLARYGGDEFIVIIHLEFEAEILFLIEGIRVEIDEEVRNANLPYEISIGIGYDEIIDKNDNFQLCLIRADKKLYENKKNMKENNNSNS